MWHISLKGSTGWIEYLKKVINICREAPLQQFVTFRISEVMCLHCMFCNRSAQWSYNSPGPHTEVSSDWVERLCDKYWADGNQSVSSQLTRTWVWKCAHRKFVCPLDTPSDRRPRQNNSVPNPKLQLPTNKTIFKMLNRKTKVNGKVNKGNLSK